MTRISIISSSLFVLSMLGCGGGGDGGGGTDSAGTGDPTGDPTGGGPRPTCDNPGGGTAQNVLIEKEEDLSKLDGIEFVSGSLWITGTQLTNLDAFICIKEVMGEVSVYGNPNLVSVAGLDNIEVIGGNLTLADNKALPIYDTLNKVVEVKSLTINGNDAATAVSGLQTLETVDGHLVIQENQSLSSLSGLAGLKAVTQTFQVTGNPNLCLSEVDAIGAGLQTGPQLDGSSTAANDDSC